MSFEGFYEFVCDNHHYWEVSSAHTYFYGYREHGNPTLCPECVAGPKFEHLRDVTNGSGEDYPESLHAPKLELDFEDKPAEDHYGNKYFIKVRRWAPIGPLWKTSSEDAS